MAQFSTSIYQQPLRSEKIEFPEIPHYNTRMPSYQQKITNTKKQESMAHSQGERNLTETIPEEAQILDIKDEDFNCLTVNAQ